MNVGGNSNEKPETARPKNRNWKPVSGLCCVSDLCRPKRQTPTPESESGLWCARNVEREAGWTVFVVKGRWHEAVVWCVVLSNIELLHECTRLRRCNDLQSCLGMLLSPNLTIYFEVLLLSPLMSRRRANSTAMLRCDDQKWSNWMQKTFKTWERMHPLYPCP